MAYKERCVDARGSGNELNTTPHNGQQKREGLTYHVGLVGEGRCKEQLEQLQGQGALLQDGVHTMGPARMMTVRQLMCSSRRFRCKSHYL